jgi:hypothetical protein
MPAVKPTPEPTPAAPSNVRHADTDLGGFTVSSSETVPSAPAPQWGSAQAAFPSRPTSVGSPYTGYQVNPAAPAWEPSPSSAAAQQPWPGGNASPGSIFGSRQGSSVLFGQDAAPGPLLNLGGFGPATAGAPGQPQNPPQHPHPDPGLQFTFLRSGGFDASLFEGTDLL